MLLFSLSNQIERQSRYKTRDVAARLKLNYFASFTIVASSEISEEVLQSLNQQGHEIDVFGVGTHLVITSAK